MNQSNVDAAIAAASDTLGAEYAIFAPTAYLDVDEQVVQVMRGNEVVVEGRGATVDDALKDALQKWNEATK